MFLIHVFLYAGVYCTYHPISDLEMSSYILFIILISYLTLRHVKEVRRVRDFSHK